MLTVRQAKGFTGPTLGAKLATSNRRSFTAAQIAQAAAAPSRWTNRGSFDAGEAPGSKTSGVFVGAGVRDIIGPAVTAGKRLERMPGDQLLARATGRGAIVSYTQCVRDQSLARATGADPLC